MSTYAVTVGYKYSPDSTVTFEYTENDIKAGDESGALFIAGLRFGTEEHTDYDPVIVYTGVVEIKGDA